MTSDRFFVFFSDNATFSEQRALVWLTLVCFELKYVPD